jgi:hypothetical protein
MQLEEPENRKLTGKEATQFKPGVSGNPAGRPKIPEELKELARAHSVDAINRLAKWMHDENPTASVKAAEALLDRAWGKANQPLTGQDGEGPVKTETTITAADDGVLELYYQQRKAKEAGEKSDA